jgi:hypothetical protein
MKIIILIQSLVILAAAAYIYWLSQNPVIIMEERAPMLAPTTTPPFLEGYTPPTENPPGYTESATSSDSSDITGHSDVGMEYPIPDAELEVR